MKKLSFGKYEDMALLIIRVIFVLLFLMSGWQKLTSFQSTVNYMSYLGAPLPMIAAIIAVIVEVGFSIAVILGYYVRPVSLIFALFTLGTAYLGHPYWHMSGPEAQGAFFHFYKNVSIACGFMLFFITGAGKYSLNNK
ncbi:DoxX family protein [Bartonella sp. CB189]|uniref:DoxX family protein n=1 Tax=Bartonella sp. CB189 TaxID=3112254 RepID=UPI002F96CAB1